MAITSIDRIDAGPLGRVYLSLGRKLVFVYVFDNGLVSSPITTSLQDAATWKPLSIRIVELVLKVFKVYNQTQSCI